MAADAFVLGDESESSNFDVEVVRSFGEGEEEVGEFVGGDSVSNTGGFSINVISLWC